MNKLIIFMVDSTAYRVEELEEKASLSSQMILKIPPFSLISQPFFTQLRKIFFFILPDSSFLPEFLHHQCCILNESWLVTIRRGYPKERRTRTTFRVNELLQESAHTVVLQYISNRTSKAKYNPFIR